MTSVGCYATGFHEGSRSEYLAQFFFSSMGTAIPVPHPEDTGIDLYCSIAKRVGKRSWPKCYYAVQVKSGMGSWEFSSQESIEWLLEQPVPVFLCVVEKKSCRLRVYQTLPRHLFWAHPPLPESIELVPEDTSEGSYTQWKPRTTCSLSAPILDCDIARLGDDGFAMHAQHIIERWIEFDQQNNYFRLSGILEVSMPHRYRTNELPDPNGITTQGQYPGESKDIEEAVEKLTPGLIWCAKRLTYLGERPIALRMALLLRKIHPDCGFPLLHFLLALSEVMGLPTPVKMDEHYIPLDRINSMIDGELPVEWRSIDTPSPPHAV